MSCTTTWHWSCRDDRAGPRVYQGCFENAQGTVIWPCSDFLHLGLLKPIRLPNTAAMTEISSSTVVILLSTAVGLLVLLLGLVIGISRRLLRIERWLAEQGSRQMTAESGPSQAETAAGGAFETFLDEDPAHRKLPKSEQFAKYRRWRQEKGLNWSNT